MDIHQLRVFASVYKNNSFSRASNDLYLTQPTISNHIKGLEDELGCKLFDRLGRSIIPTREAEVLYTHSLEIIEKAEALKEEIGKLRKDLSGKLIIGTSTIPGVYLIPRMMSAFQKKYPAISFQILISDSKGIIDNISKHALLLGIVGAKLDNEEIDYVPFIEDELIAVSEPSFTKNTMMSLRELVQLPMVFREEGSGTRKVTEKFLESKGIDVGSLPIASIFGSTDAVKQAVKAGLGITIISRFSVSDELEHNLLKEIKISDIQMKRRFYIVTHRKRTLPRIYSVFFEYIMDEYRNLRV
jgi:DNA-binding transcriptional LysR family regulator